MSSGREKQLAYSELQSKMLDEDGRRAKARKIVSILQHFLGREDLTGLRVLDIGCSTGFIDDEIARTGATVIGLDIDVPGLSNARGRFGDSVHFLCADGERLPLPDGSIDVVVFNQIYEHVVDPDAVMTEIRRVLHPDGVAYLGLGNRLQVVEPHYRLPFLSYLPARAADRYVSAFKRADRYHERFRTRRGLKRLCRGLTVWDYTWTAVAEPDRFGTRDMMPSGFDRVPLAAFKAVGFLVPTYLWIGTKNGRPPAGAPTAVPPRRVELPG